MIINPKYLIDMGQGDKLTLVGDVIRVICLLDHPIIKNTNSAQIIIPSSQVNRKNDIYIIQVSSYHNVCIKGIYVAIISTFVETENPEQELKVAYDTIGNYIHKFVSIYKMYKPVNRDPQDNVYITDNLDPTSHFESASLNVLEIYKKITGNELDLNNLEEN